MKFFSQRKGLKPIRSIIQKDAMDDSLRVGLWNTLYPFYLRNIDDAIVVIRGIDIFRDIWSHYFGKPVDETPVVGSEIVAHLKKRFFEFEWNQVYDFLEAFYNFDDNKYNAREFAKACNSVLEKELSAYRFVDSQVTDITSDEEMASIENALKNAINPVQIHLKQALELFADRMNPDYRNSIKESISAVEVLCKQIAGTPKATLGAALKEIENSKTVELHQALKQAFDKLYGYTSDANGIRHAMLEETKLSAEDARFMLVSCSAFINYLTEKAQKAGLKLS